MWILAWFERRIDRHLGLPFSFVTIQVFYNSLIDNDEALFYSL
jgi:hypothetical protein